MYKLERQKITTKICRTFRDSEFNYNCIVAHETLLPVSTVLKWRIHFKISKLHIKTTFGEEYFLNLKNSVKQIEVQSRSYNITLLELHPCVSCRWISSDRMVMTEVWIPSAQQQKGPCNIITPVGISIYIFKQCRQWTEQWNK